MTRTEDSIFAQKVSLRTQIKALRANLGESQRARASFFLGESLWSFLEDKRDQTIGVYLARPYEISLDGLIPRLLHYGFSVCAPRVELETPTMKFWRLTHLESVESGPFGVPQPLSEEEIVPEIVLMPGLAFDLKGGRIGTGGGWYDRFMPYSALRIGVGFDFQIVPNVPCEAHDLRMDFVVSDTRFCACEK